MDRLTENVIEWITGSDTATVTLSQKRYINRFRMLCKKCPQLAHIEDENEDGSIVGHISTRGVHLQFFGIKNGDALSVSDPEIDDGK